MLLLLHVLWSERLYQKGRQHHLWRHWVHPSSRDGRATNLHLYSGTQHLFFGKKEIPLKG